MPSERFGPRERARLEAKLKLVPPGRELSWAQITRIDRERLWWGMRRLNRGALLSLLVRALQEVPVSRLQKILQNHFRPGDVGAAEGEPELSPWHEVEKFCALARRGHFYEEIPYRGCEQSQGTHEFIARCSALFDRCVAEHERSDPRDARTAFEMLMDSMRRIDEGCEDIVFFTDEAGSWQVGVCWERVLPAYFRCVAQTATELEFGHAADVAVGDFCEDGLGTRAEMRGAAEKAWNSRAAVARPLD